MWMPFCRHDAPNSPPCAPPRPSRPVLVLLAMVAMGIAPALAEDAAKPATHKMAPGPFRVELSLDGVLEAREMREVVLRPDIWTELTVHEAASHASTVKKGDALISCDLTKIRESIKDLETTIKIEDLSLEQTRAEIQALEHTIPQDLAEAERSKKIADTNLSYFLQTEREWLNRTAAFVVKSYGQMLESAQEELKQLEKMYKADDLTEGTEEIILKQQRFQVETMTFLTEQAKVAREKSVQMDLPREEESLRDAVAQRTLALQKAQIDLPLTLGMKRLEFGKLKLEQAKNKEKLDKLKRDADAMIVRSPADGMVFYGACVHGQWPHAADVAQKLRPGGSLGAHEVLMTICSTDVKARVTVPEKELHDVSVGLAGTFALTAHPDEPIPAKLENVPLLADPTGKFTALVGLHPDASTKLPPRLFPSLNGSLKAVVYSKADALTVPAKSVFNEGGDDSQHYVYLSVDGKSLRRDVKIGRRTEAHVEVLEGLKEGDAVLVKKPDDE